MAAKNIIFDFGGVFLNLDFNATIHAFKKAGLDDFDSLYAKARQESLFDDFETGVITPQEFRNGIRSYASVNLTDETIDHAWNSLLLDFPVDRKDFLYELKKTHRLFLLSNTNEIHINCFENILKRDHGKNFLPEVFEKTYYSNRIGMRKPGTEIFDFVLRDNGLDPHETIFIDDTERHVKGGHAAGIRSYWLDVANTDVIQLVKRILG